MTDTLWAVILAGGAGTRLWPMSRSSRPKQFQALLGDDSMLQTTAERLHGLVPPERTFVVTGQAYVDEARSQLPLVPPANVLGEPFGLGTAPAFGLGLAAIRATADQRGWERGSQDSDVVLCLSADHAVEPADGFRSTLRVAARAAAAGTPVVIGIEPTYPATGYGYISLGPAAGNAAGAFEVAEFVEKPDAESAEEMLAAGGHMWNAGMFVWTLAVAEAEFRRYLPGLAAAVARLEGVLADGDTGPGLEAIWSSITEATTLDYGILERSTHVRCVPAAFRWSDVGTWNSLGDTLRPDTTGNVVVGDAVLVDAADCVIVAKGGRPVVALGVSDLVVVDVGDALLVMPRSRTEDVRHVVDALRRGGRNELL